MLIIEFHCKLTDACKLLEKAESCLSTESEPSLKAFWSSCVFLELAMALNCSLKVFWNSAACLSRSCSGDDAGASRRTIPADACRNHNTRSTHITGWSPNIHLITDSLTNKNKLEKLTKWIVTIKLLGTMQSQKYHRCFDTPLRDDIRIPAVSRQFATIEPGYLDQQGNEVFLLR